MPVPGEGNAQPLTGIRVLDLSGELGVYCGKLLADVGADVTEVEPPGGDLMRRSGPFEDFPYVCLDSLEQYFKRIFFVIGHMFFIAFSCRRAKRGGYNASIMVKTPGARAQIWCRTPLTHGLCSGYRFELLEGQKVEGLCTCTCHSAAVLMIEDLKRFDQAQSVSSLLDENFKLTEILLRDSESENDLGDLGIQSRIDSLSRAILNSTRAAELEILGMIQIAPDSAHSCIGRELLGFYVHWMDRVLFSWGGDTMRTGKGQAVVEMLAGDVRYGGQDLYDVLNQSGDAYHRAVQDGYRRTGLTSSTFASTLPLIVPEVVQRLQNCLEQQLEWELERVLYVFTEHFLFQEELKDASVESTRGHIS